MWCGVKKSLLITRFVVCSQTVSDFIRTLDSNKPLGLDYTYEDKDYLIKIEITAKQNLQLNT